MAKYTVISGEAHSVEANSPEHAEAIYMIAMGYMVGSDYDFVITEEDLDTLKWVETRTIVEED